MDCQTSPRTRSGREGAAIPDTAEERVGRSDQSVLGSPRSIQRCSVEDLFLCFVSQSAVAGLHCPWNPYAQYNSAALP